MPSVKPETWPRPRAASVCSAPDVNLAFNLHQLEVGDQEIKPQIATLRSRSFVPDQQPWCRREYPLSPR